MRKWILRAAVGLLLLSALVAPVSAQQWVRLQIVSTQDTLSSSSDSVVLNSDAIGGFGSVKIQTLDSYTGTWEVQCSVRNTDNFDTGAELKITPADSSSAVTSVSDEVGIWDVQNAAGCRSIKVQATAGFAATDTVVIIAATQTGGAGGGGGGGAASTVAISQTGTDNDVDATIAFTLTETDDNSIASGQSADTTINLPYMFNGSAWVRVLGNATDGLLVNLGANNDVTVTGTVTANLSATDNAVLDDIADGIPVTNAGTFAVQVDGNALTALQLIDNIVSVEDAVAGSAFSGVGILAVRQDSHVDLAADGDFIPLTIDADGGLRVSIVAGAGSGGTALADDGDITAGTTSMTPAGGFYQSSVTACTDGDACIVGITAQRTLKATLFNAAGTELSVATDVTEDAAETAGGTGPMVISVRRDTAASSAGTTGDNATFNTDAVGRLWTSGANLEDVASATGDQGLVIFAIRDDTLDARSGTEGDFEYLHLNANGALWTIDVNSAASLTAVQLIDDIVGVEDAAETAGGGLSRAGTVRRDTMASSAGATGDNATLNTDANGLAWTRNADPCTGLAKTYINIDITTATTTELTPSLAGASTYYYVCALNLVTAAANNVALVDDDSDGCGSPTAGLSGGLTAGEGWNFAANSGLMLGSGGGSVMRAITANSVLCLVTSAATQLSGQIAVVAAP